MKYSNGITSCENPAVTVNQFQNHSFSITAPEGQCTFLAPKRSLDIHKGQSINCIALSPDRMEVLSGDSSGHLYLTHLGTEPVPLPGPTPGFDIESCIFDPSHKLFFSCGGDFRIYEFSSTEYQPTGRYDGHRSSVKSILVYGDNLYSGSHDSQVCIWDISTHKRLSSANMGHPVNDICFSSNDLIFAATEQSISAIDRRTQQSAVSPTFEKGLSFNTIASFENELVTGTDDGKVIGYDIRNLSQPFSEFSWFDSPINKLRYCVGKLWVATNDGTAACINMAEKRSYVVLGTISYVPIRDLALSELTIWTASGEGIMQNFDL
ncbi:Proteasomal ATPase-associated factor 1 [Histomonas meleagridis]|uniref:Proteasomal ATPase-associated factor 1 n=1 Tax=Histomonas meleagridis TaxID=135588 RepID=UPI003559EA70|nr:Proteasomal ATPase-associated factor 1 [Histomonas meleagridis]KAH0805063.1 Proteasomal ATPase-associated factor 1 [Histomonas meleagridis]